MAFHCGVGIHIPQQDEHHPAYGYILPTTGWIRDFNLLETCAARHTKENSAAFGDFPGSCAVCWPLRHDKDNYRARFLL